LRGFADRATTHHFQEITQGSVLQVLRLHRNPSDYGEKPYVGLDFSFWQRRHRNSLIVALPLSV
jgi:hypothetical protein